MSAGRCDLSYKERSTVSTWEDVLNVTGECPVKQCVKHHHEDGHPEAVTHPLLWAVGHVVPLDAHALLLVLGKVLAAVAKGHTRQQALETETQQGDGV